MKMGTDNRRQIILASVLGVCALGACIFLYEELFGGTTPPPAAPPVAVNTPAASSGSAPVVRTAVPVARAVGTSSAGLDPTLHMDAMLVSESVVYSGTGRNIFSANSVPVVVIPKPIATARIIAPVAIPCPPSCPIPAVQPLPPIDLKFFGTVTGANGNRHAFLLHDEIVYVASAGDVVLRRYRVITIDAKTIQVEDMQNNNKQTLPLLTN